MPPTLWLQKEAAPAAEEEEDDELVEKKPSKDPFAHLPKGTLNMDEWKKVGAIPFEYAQGG